eukprot:gene2289-5284_t
MLQIVSESCPDVTADVIGHWGHYLVMQDAGKDLLIFGETVLRLLPTIEEFEAQLKPIIRQVVSHLCTLHKIGIAHLDIKPDNIVVCKNDDGEYEARLIDFEFAKTALPLPSMPGTVQYVAPEHLQVAFDDPMARVIGTHTDVFCLGLVIYVMLSRQFPFGIPRGLISVDQLSYAMRARVRSCDINLAELQTSGVTKEVIDLLQAMLAIDIANRPTMKEVLQYPWLNPCL